MPLDPPDLGPAEGESDGVERIPDPAPRHTPLWALLSGWLLAIEAWLQSHGGKGLRNGIRAFWAIVAVAGLVLLFGPVINKPLTLEDVTTAASTASERWIAREFAVEYTIGTADDGTLVAQVEERITAFFPDDVDESGIQRVLATQYQTHSLGPSGITASLDGQPIEAVQSSTPDRLTLALDAGSRLRGDHVFVLRYELHDLAYQADDQAGGRPIDLLEWDVFGPSWPTALARVDVRVHLADDLDERLIREPRGSVAWTIVGAGDWLSPEPGGPAGTVTYAFENNQNLPPHASAWFTMAFEPGTFTMPPPSALFWVQAYGPLLPLVLLALTLLLALAARAVAWADARGRPWFIAQSDPPTGMTPRLAAHLLESRRAVELAEALQTARSRSKGRADRIRAVARVARRTGRIGDLPRALTRYATGKERAQQLKLGLRRIPHGFVRDLFIGAPIALTVVQWGLVRQLSHQAKLSVVWWPVAFVLVSSVIAIVVLWIALTARPLTESGALTKQHLRGMSVYARQTSLFERGPLSDPALPYAVLFDSPREAGDAVVRLAREELGDPDVTRGWRIPGFLTWPRLLMRLVAVGLVAGAIVLISTLPSPYSGRPDYLGYHGNLPGTLWTKVHAFEATAELRRDGDRAVIDVVETLDVAFDDQGSRVPQFAQQWPNRFDGQPNGLEVDSVRIDGRDVAFTTEQDHDTLLMRTTLTEVLDGRHELEVRYTIRSAAIAADADGGLVDRVVWPAILDGWEYDSMWGADPPIEPLRIELRVPDEFAASALAAGWISKDTEPEEVRDWTHTVVPFGSVPSIYNPGETVETLDLAGGMRVHVLDLAQDEHGGYPFALTVGNVGAALDFPAGTFAGPDADALQALWIAKTLPLTIVVALSALVLLIGIGALVLRTRARTVLPGALSDALRWLGTGTALAAVVVAFWMLGDLSGDDPLVAVVLGCAAAALLGAVLGWLATRPAVPAGD